jgi:hypothetical protein
VRALLHFAREQERGPAYLALWLPRLALAV